MGYLSSIQLLFNLHIEVLQRVFLQVPFEQIVKYYSERMERLNYIKIMRNSGHLSFDSHNELVGAYPVSPVPSNYQIDLDGVGQGYSMCAIDALGLPYTFMRKAVISSTERMTGDAITITIDPNLDRQVSLDLFVTYQDSPDELQGDRSAAIVQCPNIHFYYDKNNIPDQLQVWDYNDALQYSRSRFGKEEMMFQIKKAIDGLNL